jgi:hypothetical protein
VDSHALRPCERYKAIAASRARAIVGPNIRTSRSRALAQRLPCGQGPGVPMMRAKSDFTNACAGHVATEAPSRARLACACAAHLSLRRKSETAPLTAAAASLDFWPSVVVAE